MHERAWVPYRQMNNMQFEKEVQWSSRYITDLVKNLADNNNAKTFRKFVKSNKQSEIHFVCASYG